ncbi:MAG TPA: hypothetical protein VK914_11615 [bacterium]|jgi:hypothetical protein|nr:hypothetical protein [bacterium]
MIRIKLGLIGCLIAAVPCMAAGADAPPAATTPAHPSYSATPTAEQAGLSRKYLASGLEFLRQGQSLKAVQDFQDSVRLAPGAENFEALGMAYHQAGMRPKAVWALQESLRIKPDAKVRSLADSWKVGPAGGAEIPASYRLLMVRARGEAGSGQRDAAVSDYSAAYGLVSGPESAAPCLPLAADAVERDLGRADLVAAVYTLSEVGALRRAAGLGADLGGVLGRLDRAEARVARWSGMSLRDSQKAMLIDHDAWVSAMRTRASLGEPGH